MFDNLTRIITHVSASPFWFTGILAVSAVLLVVALDYLNRHMRRRRRLDDEWRMVDQIARERALSAVEIEQLLTMLRAQAPDNPLRTLTIRQAFDACVDAYMAHFEKRPTETYEKLGVQLRDIRERMGLTYVPFGQGIRSTREMYTGQPVNMSGHMDHPETDINTGGVVVEVDEAVFRIQVKGECGEIFAPGEPVHFAMWREDDARYLFSAKYVRKERQPDLLVFRHSTSLRRVQVREHFRVSFDAQATVGILGESSSGESLEREPVVGRMRGRFTSLSAGGCALVLPQQVQKGLTLRVSIPDEGGQELQADARVVAVTALPAGQFLARAAFVGLTEDQQDVISRIVLKRQRPLTKNAGNAG